MTKRNAELASVAAQHLEEWYALHDGVPGAEVHRDPDVTWMLMEGSAWRNGGTALRFRDGTAARRLDEILARFEAAGRPAGFWVDPDATPAGVEKLLKERRFRCRKHFPAMWCDTGRVPRVDPTPGIAFRVLDDHALYRRHPHPYFGRISTPIRRAELARLVHLTRAHAGRVVDFVALAGERPVGACTLFLGRGSAGFHDVGVLDSERGKGIGSALMAHALRYAKDRGHDQATLIATGMGSRMYVRVGFCEVGTIGFWYRAGARSDQ